MDQPRILTLTTDFGLEGSYVAAIKGVVLGLAPRTSFVDVSHLISPQNVLEGAFVLGEIVSAFPPGTVHLGVVDPGVGTDRRLIALLIEDQWFIVPDNGLISGVTRTRTPSAIWEIVNPQLRRSILSQTFHGRDILAPAAAHLLLGGDPDEFGPKTSKWVSLRNFRPLVEDHVIVGEVIFRDVFGNLITNIAAQELGDDPGGWTVEVVGNVIGGLGRTYGDHPTGSLIALTGSTGWLEVAIVNGDAGSQLSAGPGTTVWIRRTN